MEDKPVPFSGAVSHRGGHVLQGGWKSWLCRSRSAVLVRAEIGEPGQGEWSTPSGAHLPRIPWGVGAECGLEAEAWLCWVHPPLSIDVHLGPTGTKDGRSSAGDASSLSSTCTYLQEAVLKVLAGVWMVLQGWGLAAVKGLYGVIQAAVPGEELPEGVTLLPPISAGSAVAPGRHARARVVHVVRGDCGACGNPES